MSEGFAIYDRPKLNSPCLVVGFSGWLDGGEASTGTVRYLVRKLGAKKIGEMDPSDFTIFQVPGIQTNRPQVVTDDGVVSEVRFPQNQLYYWEAPPPRPHDLLLLVGTEPNLKWMQYTEAMLRVAEQFGVTRVYSSGGVLDAVPFTREPTVSCSVSDARLREEVGAFAVRFSNYKGPATFNSVVVAACKQKGMEAVHLTARSIYYPEFNITVPNNPKAIHAIVRRLNHLIGLGLDLSDLDRANKELEDKLQFMVSQSPELRKHIEELERNYVEYRYKEPIDGAPEDFVKDAEEFLRRQRGEDGR